MKFVIVGGGIAGTTCAEELRKLDPNAEITILSEEQHPIYSRVLLPHYLKAKIPRERVFLKPADWYQKQNIEWLPGVRVEKLDVTNRFALTSEGRELPYDKLLLATGGEIETLPEDRRGVSYLRTLDDADHLIQLSADRHHSEAAIYGGGFIACEYLNYFAHLGWPTTIAFRGPHFWSRILDAESGKLLNEHIRSRGVTVLPETTFEGLVGEHDLEAVSLRGPQGRSNLRCSILGVGIGIRSELSWIAESGVEVGRGVRANEYLETNVPDVWTAGDGAEFFDVVVGHHRQVGNWMNAQMQGRVAAKNMVGEKTAFRLVSSYSTNALGLEIIFVGETDPKQADETRVFGSAAEGGVTNVFLKMGKAVGATIIGRNKDRAPVTKAIDSQEPFVSLQ
jgi:NAD(P)H-nitrite reductase large subunit